MHPTFRAGLAAAALLLAATTAQAQAPLVAEGCVPCHGPAGKGGHGIPAIAGRDATDLRIMLVAFRANERLATIMGRVTRGYSEAELAAAAEHFSKLPR